MIAEIEHKLARYGMEESEDKLTGDFFGCMRYIPYTHGLKYIFFFYAQSKHDCEFENILKSINEDEFEFVFWKRSDEGEIDAHMVIDDVSIGIEVKLNSKLSGEDQLIREARMLREWDKNNQYKKLLLFVARNKDIEEVYYNNYDKTLREGVHLGCISWENILQGLRGIKSDIHYEKLIINDLCRLLEQKGFDGFLGFKEDVEVDKNGYYRFG